jgi:Ca2+-binding EF-hand superfamily protein
MALNYFVKRKRVLGFYFFDLTKDGLMREEDIQTFGKRIAAKLNFKPGSDSYKKVTDATDGYWAAFAPASDINGDGTVTCDELLSALAKVFDLPTGKELYGKLNASMFDAMDVNGNGTISKEEYTIFVAAAGVSTDAAHKAFQKLDLDGSGVMSRDEFSECLWEYWNSEDPKARGNWFFANH